MIMKRIITITGAIFFAITGLIAQEKAKIETAGGPEMTFETEVIDYGTISQNADGVEYLNLLTPELPR